MKANGAVIPIANAVTKGKGRAEASAELHPNPVFHVGPREL